MQRDIKKKIIIIITELSFHIVNCFAVVLYGGEIGYRLQKVRLWAMLEVWLS